MKEILESSDFYILIVFKVVCFFAVLSNLFVIKVIRKNPFLKSNTFTFLSNQAYSDALYGLSHILSLIFCTDSFAKSFLSLQVSCEVNFLLGIAFLVLSTYFILLTSFDRYYKLYYPHNAPLNAQLWSAITWIAIIVIISPIIVGMQITTYFPGDALYGCITAFASLAKLQFFKDEYKFIVLSALINWIPLILTLYFYVKVIIKIKAIKKVGIQSQAKEKKDDERKNKTIRMLIVMTVVFYVIWLPFLLHTFVRLFNPNLTMRCGGKLKNNDMIGIKFAFITTVSSALINPMILIYYNSHFSGDAKKLCNRVLGIQVFKKDPISTVENSKTSNATRTSNLVTAV